MQCHEFEQRLQLLLDERRIPEQDSLLAQHAAVCAHCSAVLHAQQTLFNTLDLLDAPPLDADFARRVVAQVPREHPRVRRHDGSIVIAAITIAASLMLAIFGPTPANLQRPTANNRVNRLSSAATNADSVPDVVVAGSSNQHDSSIWWILSPEALREIYPENVRQRHLRQVDRIANDLRPITRSFTAAAEALRRTFPVNRSRTPKGRPQASQLPARWLSRWS